MARPNKAGLDYFELDCQLEEKIRLIQAEFGLKGFAVVVKLYQKIYGGFGYYCEWSEDSLLLFMSENGLPSDNKNLISEIVSACIRRKIFSEELFNKFNILTSEGVQKRYLNATSRREIVELKKEYLLLSVGKNNKNVVINSINVFNNTKNVNRNSQSKEEKSREENNNINVQVHLAPPKKPKIPKKQIDDFFETVWKLYPKKRGKGKVSEAKKIKLYEIGIDELTRAIERYKNECSDIQFMQNGSTFFNSGYVDYLDENYSDLPRTEYQRPKNSHQFKERDYNYDSLEKQLRQNQNKQVKALLEKDKENQ
ncbi:MAG: DUF4373 domain-containing protein [Eubacterium sp.]